MFHQSKNIIFGSSLICLGLSLMLTACGPSSQTRPSHQDPGLEAEAVTLIEAGDYSRAADEYLRLAEENQQHASTYQLKAAGAYFEAADMTQAKDVLSKTEPSRLSQLQSLQKNILLARIALVENDAGTALSLLAEPPIEGTPNSLLMAWHETRAGAYSQTGDIPTAVQERMQAETYADATTGHNIDYDSLWQDLQQLDTAKLEETRLSATAALASWLDLASINKNLAGNQTQLQTAIYDWQGLNPGHAANDTIIPELLANSMELNKKAETVAVLLPMSGRYRQASLAIREGLMAGWHNDSLEKPELRFYNADALNVNQVYQLAVEEGADFIIGPLEKEAVNNLVNSGNPRVRTLTLNYYDGDLQNRLEGSIQPGVNFFQFALSPEDEARQVAERAYFEGLHKALVIAPNNLWGDRIYQAFQAHLEQLGGQVLERTVIDSENGDYSKAIIALLNTDSSKARAKELRQILNRKLESETRRRQDVDFIFMAAQPNDARQIVPHVHFQRASNVPVFATSHIYSSSPNPEMDADMNNIQFLDIPWILDSNTPFADVKYTIEQNWPSNSSTIKRLFALGIDTYQLIANLQQLPNQANAGLQGTTGRLYLNDQGQVQRKMSWAKFQNGVPELLGQSY